MREPSRFELWYGRDEPPVETRELQAGPLVAQLEGIDLRYVRVGDVEVVRRLFVAIRDSAWGTIPPHVSGLDVEAGDDFFRVSFETVHEAGPLRFRWRGELAGESDGSLRCRMDGVAESAFQYNRIGFCVLHPRENAGRAYRARTTDGEISGELPDAIGIQRFEDGKLWPLFPSYDRLEIEVAEHLWARFEFEGDLFEMEDQRNWTDASFKTYSTPLTLGWPHDAAKGQAIAQTVRLTFPGRAPAPRRAAAEAVRLELGEPTRREVPAVGLGMAHHGEPLTEREVDLLTQLRPVHLRADLRLGDAWRDELERAGDAALSLGAALELALFLGEEPEAELDALAAGLPLAQARVERLLVFKAGEIVTDARWVRLARERLASAARGAAFAGGTDGWFVDLNRNRPELDGLDAVAYSINATVHADDDTSVHETPSAQGDTVRSARAFCGDLPIVVSPVTIRPRSWPFGDQAQDPDALPFPVDPRQGSLFGAAWTVASLKHLAEAGAASITYFETTGWRGVVERETGSPRPDKFRSRPSAAFPLYHVLADFAGWRGAGAVVPVRSSEPLAVEALAARTDAGFYVVAANLRPERQRCTIAGLAAERAAVRTLDERSAIRAGDDPMTFREERERRDAPGGRLELELEPYAVVRVEP